MTRYNIPSGIKSDSTSMILKEIDRTSVSMLYSNIPIHFLAPLFALKGNKGPNHIDQESIRKVMDIF